MTHILAPELDGRLVCQCGETFEAPTQAGCVAKIRRYFDEIS